MTAHGFLGTSASLTADLSLVLGLLVALTLTVGVVMARRRRFVVHRWIQSSAVCLNVLQVGVVMLGSFTRSAAPGIPDRLGESYFAVAVGHGLLGSATLLFGVFVALRANELVPGWLRFHNYKLFMRSAYGLYIASTLAGVAVYLTWYTGKPADVAASAANTNEVVISMANFEFPPEVVVPVGSTVVWVNQDGAPHTATADDGHSFQSDLLAKGQRFSLVATALGEFTYYCELHGSPGGVGMAGTLKVVARDQVPVVAAPAPAPLPTPAPTPQPRPAAQTVPAIAELLVDGPGLPTRQGYAVGLRTETEELERHARLLIAAESSGDLAGIRRHAEHLYNLIAGARDPHFGDLDGDGHAQNAGDGFGLLRNGDQAGYIGAVMTSADAAAADARATPSMQLHSAQIDASLDNLEGWAIEARGLALDLTRASDLRQVEQPAGRLMTLAKWLALGNDANGDGEISPIPGEGGARVAYAYAQFMAQPTTP